MIEVLDPAQPWQIYLPKEDRTRPLAARDGQGVVASWTWDPHQAIWAGPAWVGSVYRYGTWPDIVKRCLNLGWKLYSMPPEADHV